MAIDNAVDYYEVLQVNPSADLDTIHRVYRLLAQRFHPDNRESGNEARFRELSDAYQTLGDPERRARYDVTYNQTRKDRWRLVASGAQSEDDFAVGSGKHDGPAARAPRVHDLVSAAEEVRDARRQLAPDDHR
jgi:curved DNA-binding protein CbpA